MRFGSRRLWCDETINEVIGIDDQHVAIRGHANAFVYDHTTGDRVTGIDPSSIRFGDAPFHPSIVNTSDRWAKTSPDGRWACVASIGHRARVYDNTTGEMKFADDPAYAFDALAFSPDGSRIAALADGVWVYGEQTVRVPGIQYGIAWVGNDLVGGVVGKLARWSLDGTEQARVSIRHKVETLSFTDDGTRAAVTTIYTSGLCAELMPDVVVADLVRGTAILRFHDRPELGRSVSLSRDGRWLITTDDDGVRLYSAEPRAPWTKPPVLAHWPDHYLATLTGDRALLIDRDQRATPIALPSGEPLGPAFKREGHGFHTTPGALYELALDQRRVIVRDPQTFEITGERGFDMHIDVMAVSRDGKQLAITDGPTIDVVAL